MLGLKPREVRKNCLIGAKLLSKLRLKAMLSSLGFMIFLL